MINVLLNVYEFDAAWAHQALKDFLSPDMQVAVLTMSHGDEIPDAAAWERLYRPSGEIYRILTGTFSGYGIPETSVRFVSWYHDTPESAEEAVRNSDAIFMTGGLPDVLYDRLCQWGLDALLRRYPGVVIGCSAGALVQMTEYHITPDADYDTYGYYPGLGLLEGFEPEVHYAASPVQQESIHRYLKERGKPVYAITNSGGLIVNAGKMIPMGEVTCISEG